MASLSLSNAELVRAISTIMGVSRDAADLDVQTLDDMRAIIRSGLRQFYTPPPIDGGIHQWRFLERQFTAPADAAYETGTITLSGGTATLAGGTWPTWAADGVLRADGRTLFATARTSDTALEVSHEGLSLDAGTEYVLYRWRYPLPADFGEFIGGVIYNNGNRAYPIRGANDAEIRLRFAATFRTGETAMYAIVPGGELDSADWYFTFWPTFDAEALVSATYRSSPQDNLNAADLTADGAVVQADAAHAGTMLASIMAAAELFSNDAKGVHHQDFMEKLAASIKHDRHTQGPISHETPRGAGRSYFLLNHQPTYNNLLP